MNLNIFFEILANIKMNHPSPKDSIEHPQREGRNMDVKRQGFGGFEGLEAEVNGMGRYGWTLLVVEIIKNG